MYLKTKRKPFLVRLSNTDDYRVYPKQEKKLNRHFFSNSKRHNKEIQYLHLYVFFRVKIASTLIVLILYLVLYSACSRNLYRLTDYGNVIVLNSIFYWSGDCVLMISILSRRGIIQKDVTQLGNMQKGMTQRGITIKGITQRHIYFTCIKVKYSDLTWSCQLLSGSRIGKKVFSSCWLVLLLLLLLKRRVAWFNSDKTISCSLAAILNSRCGVPGRHE